MDSYVMQFSIDKAIVLNAVYDAIDVFHLSIENADSAVGEICVKSLTAERIILRTTTVLVHERAVTELSVSVQKHTSTADEVAMCLCEEIIRIVSGNFSCSVLLREV